jgi:hypothetical protein
MRGSIAFKSLAVLFICLVVGYLVLGNRGYGEVSDRAYEISTALYSVCNRQDAAQLAGIESLLDSVQSKANVSPAEAEILHEILRTAQAGDWKSATSESRALMEDQVKYP